jgi:hypothetical protein
MTTVHIFKPPDDDPIDRNLWWRGEIKQVLTYLTLFYLLVILLCWRLQYTHPFFIFLSDIPSCSSVGASVIDQVDGSPPHFLVKGRAYLDVTCPFHGLVKQSLLPGPHGQLMKLTGTLPPLRGTRELVQVLTRLLTCVLVFRKDWCADGTLSP